MKWNDKAVTVMLTICVNRLMTTLFTMANRCEAANRVTTAAVTARFNIQQERLTTASNAALTIPTKTRIRDL